MRLVYKYAQTVKFHRNFIKVELADQFLLKRILIKLKVLRLFSILTKR